MEVKSKMTYAKIEDKIKKYEEKDNLHKNTLRRVKKKKKMDISKKGKV